MKLTIALAALSGLALTACSKVAPPFSNPPAFTSAQIEHDSEGKCYGRDVSPAVIETVTEQIMVQPAQVTSDGAVLSPAAFRTVTRQHIMRERREVLFETVCPAAMTVEFVSSLQRALTARGYFSGEITGYMDADTSSALQKFQRQQDGVDSPLLDVRTAQALGLVALTREQLGLPPKENE